MAKKKPSVAGPIADLNATIERRNQLHDQVIKSLAHLPRDHALNVIMSWIALENLEDALPTICGSDPPVEDKVDQFLHRLNIAGIQRNIKTTITAAEVGGWSKKRDKMLPHAELTKLLRAALLEAVS